jgi:hypothetical protein
MGRSIGGVFAGYLMFGLCSIAFFQLSNRTPEANPTPIFMTVSIVYGIVVAILAGWVTGRVVGHGETAHGIMLAFVIAVVALGSYLFAATFKWSEMLTMFVFAPMAVVGGVWRESQRKGSA